MDCFLVAGGLLVLLLLSLWFSSRRGTANGRGSLTYSDRSGRMSRTYTTDSKHGQNENESENPDTDEEER